MANKTIPVFVESRYKVNRKRIIATLSQLLDKQEILRDVEVSVAVIGNRKMRELNRKYRGKDKTTNVLSFSLSEGDAVVMPPVSSEGQRDVLRLGDIVVSYPEVIAEAAEENVLVDDKVDELVTHGLLHLLGIHHEE